jgi:hypothetical protein
MSSASTFQARLELIAVDQSVGVDVDQAIHGRLGCDDLLLKRTFGIRRCWCFEPSFVLLAQQLRIAKQFTGIGPHRLIEFVCAHLGVLADSLASEAICICSHTAIVCVRCLSFGARTADRLAVVRVTTARACEQALQQVLRSASSFATAQPVLRQLILHGGEDFQRDDGGDRDPDLLCRARVIGGTNSARHFRLAARFAELSATWSCASLAECCRAHISRVF